MTKTILTLTSCALLAAASVASAADAKEELIQAAKALDAKENYSWRTTVVVPDDAQFKPGPTEGKAVKGGLIKVAQEFEFATLETYKQGDKAAMNNQDGGWDSLAEVESQEGFGPFRAAMARNLFAPSEDVVDMAKHLQDVKKEGEVYSGELTEAGAKALLGLNRRAGGGGGMNVPAGKGSAKFWVTDGVLSKLEVKLEGAIEFGGNEMDVKRTSTTVIKEIGSTKLDVPDAAKAKLK
jgi:hypothetical protein